MAPPAEMLRSGEKHGLWALGFICAVFFVPGLYAAATVTRWSALAVGVPWLLMFVRGEKFDDATAAHWAGAAFFLWACLSLTWSPHLLDGGRYFFELVILSAAFMLGARLSAGTLRWLLVGAAWGLALSSVVATIQWVGMNVDGYDAWRRIVWPREDGPAGLFVNANTLAEAAALVMIGCAAYRMWLPAAVAAPALLLAESRGAMLSIVFAGGVWLWQQGRVYRLISVSLACMAGAVVVGVTAHGWKMAGTELRLGLWQDAAAGLTWFGHGLGSYYATIPYTTTHLDLTMLRAEHAHSDLLEYLYELGPIGFVLLAAFVLAVGFAATPAGLIWMAFGLQACVNFTSHMPLQAGIALICAGVAARERSGLRRAESWCRDAVQRRVAKQEALRRYGTDASR